MNTLDFKRLEILFTSISRQSSVTVLCRAFLRKRDDSTLARGVTPISEVGAKKLYNRVMSFANAIFSEIES